MRRRSQILSCLALMLCAGTASAQLDRYTVDVGPSDACSLIRGHGIHATRDGGCIITGGTHYSCDGLNLVKIKYNGNVEWEKHYSYTYEFNHGGRGYDVVPTQDEGYAVGAVPEVPYDFVYKLGILKVDGNGDFLWGRMTQGDDIDGPMAYKRWEGIRIKELPDGSLVTIGVRDDYLDHGPCSETYFESGMLFKVKSDGTPVFSYQIGQAGWNGYSHVTFIDLDVNDYGIFVFGTIRDPRECLDCGLENNGLLAWFDFDGNFQRAWTFDSPNDPAPPPWCDRKPSPEWGCGLRMDGLTAYFSMTDTMAYDNKGNAMIGRFDIGSGLVWGDRHKELYPMYHCVDLDERGNVLVGGHWDGDSNEIAGLVALDPTAGVPLWGKYYKDPRSPINSLWTLRGVAHLPGSDTTWLLGGGTWSSPNDLYYMLVDGNGKSECSSDDRNTGDREEFIVDRVELEVIREWPIKRWHPDTFKPSTVAVDPCH